MLSTVTIVVNLAFSLILVRWLGFRGLAVATSLAAIVHGGLALVLLRRQLDGIGGGHLAMTFFKIAGRVGSDGPRRHGRDRGSSRHGRLALAPAHNCFG